MLRSLLLLNFQWAVWDATCCDTFAISHVRVAVSELGAVAAKAEENKKDKYRHLDALFCLYRWQWRRVGLLGRKQKSFSGSWGDG